MTSPVRRTQLPDFSAANFIQCQCLWALRRKKKAPAERGYGGRIARELVSEHATFFLGEQLFDDLTAIDDLKRSPEWARVLLVGVYLERVADTSQ